MSFAFIDTHVHFWDRGRLPYPWLDEVPAIAGRHTPAELRAEAAGRFPEKIVFVECGAPWLDEVKWVEQLAAVVRLVRACPDTRFVLDHFGKPGIKAGLLDPWRGHIQTLAHLPNVDCKLSGLITEADHQSWKPAELKP
jgi:predicted TIM-barrel fold metal-dependent hydrolase